MSWIQHPVVLDGKRAKLLPLEEKYFSDLVSAASDAKTWEHLPTDGSNKDDMLLDLKSAVLKRISGEQYSFVVIDKVLGKAIGGTRLFNIYAEHKKLEIGWTWFSPVYWGTGYNVECKFLLLTYCFEVLKAERIQFQTSVENKRSQTAIEKIGGKFEGMLRNDRVRRNGVRNTLMYSIIIEEWSDVKTMLQAMV